MKLWISAESTRFWKASTNQHKLRKFQHKNTVLKHFLFVLMIMMHTYIAHRSQSPYHTIVACSVRSIRIWRNNDRRFFVVERPEKCNFWISATFPEQSLDQWIALRHATVMCWHSITARRGLQTSPGLPQRPPG